MNWTMEAVLERLAGDPVRPKIVVFRRDGRIRRGRAFKLLVGRGFLTAARRNPPSEWVNYDEIVDIRDPKPSRRRRKTGS